MFVMKIKEKMSSFGMKYLRVWRLLKKPTMNEFKTIAKVTAVGLLIIGAIGFLISIGMTAFH